MKGGLQDKGTFQTEEYDVIFAQYVEKTTYAIIVQCLKKTKFAVWLRETVTSAQLTCATSEGGGFGGSPTPDTLN